MQRRVPSTLLLLALALPACDPAVDDDGAAADDAATDGGDDGATGGQDDSASSTGDSGGVDESGSGDDESTDTGPVGDQEWSEISGPCFGSGTNALWFDDRDHAFVGCGENADGEGLYTTSDNGATWEDHPKFNEVRIMDIRRGPDGVLRGAGIHQLDGYSVWEIDESGALDSVGLYTPGNSAFTSVSQAENVAVTADGQVLIDSLTGSSAAYGSVGGEFEEVCSLGEDAIEDPDNASCYQVRRIVGFDNQFYSVGSLINDPARVHLPSMMPGATYHFTTLELQPETRDGELLDMHVWSESSMIVAGHNQSTRYPLIYVADGDPYNLDNWTQIELLDFGIEFEGGINDLHVSGDTVIAVGELFPTSSGGFVLISHDRGLTWEDVSPEGLGPASASWLFEDGSMAVAGGSGEMWVYE